MAQRKCLLVTIPNARMIRAFLDTPLFATIAATDVDIAVLHTQPSIAHLIRAYPNVREVRWPTGPKRGRWRAFANPVIDVPSLVQRRNGMGRIGLLNMFLTASNRLQRARAFLRGVVAWLIGSTPGIRTLFLRV